MQRVQAPLHQIPQPLEASPLLQQIHTQEPHQKEQLPPRREHPPKAELLLQPPILHPQKLWPSTVALLPSSPGQAVPCQQNSSRHNFESGLGIGIEQSVRAEDFRAGDSDQEDTA